MSDVIPFDPHRRRKGQPPKVAPEHGHLHHRTKRAAPEARELAAQQSRAANAKYSKAYWRQEEERLLREERPIPARITMALDLRELYGPEVDLACGTWEGNPDGDVDAWEAGTAVPRAEQVRLLSEVACFPVTYFYMAVKVGLQLDGVIMCTDSGCERLEPDVIDERGVLHRAGEVREAPGAQGALF